MAPSAQDALIAGLANAQTPESPALSHREHALVMYADLLTLTPAAVTADDIAALRSVGMDDRAIHDACAIIAYFAFVNRIADGLGVELE